MLRLAPITVKRALPFVRQVHRRLPRVQGAMWSVGAFKGDELVGAALVGNPSRVWNGEVLGVLRVAVIEGHPNACSMLYGSCSRAGKAMGARNMVTYTHGDEHATSLKASGWIDGGFTDGGEWTKPSRQRELAVDPKPKRRWWTPWSERAPARSSGIDGLPRATQAEAARDAKESPSESHGGPHGKRR